jgi:hypothetical protein
MWRFFREPAMSRLGPAALIGLVALGGCAVALPTGPSVLAVPGKGKTLAAFQEDDLRCRGYAQQRVSYGSAYAASQGATGNAVAGTVLGGALGALFGAATGNPSAGAAFGAGSGLLFGSASGAGAAAASSAGLQRQYDISYMQCMVAAGDTVPALAGYYPYGYPGYPYAPY